MQNIYKKLAMVQQELKAPKSQFNSFGKYNYRNQEDILEAVKPLLAKHNLTLIISDETTTSGIEGNNVFVRFYIKATALLVDIESGEKIANYAYAREEEEKKGMDASQITGAASSYARKYALNGLFLIDDTKDSDYTNGINSDSTPKSNIKTLLETAKGQLKTGDEIKGTGLNGLACQKCSENITTAESVYSKQKYGQALCRKCQKEGGVA
jgi:hypothetical protein